jgi:hypothetical protein
MATQLTVFKAAGPLNFKPTSTKHLFHIMLSLGGVEIAYLYGCAF